MAVVGVEQRAMAHGGIRRVFIVGLLALAAGVMAQPQAKELKPGSAERKALAEALRPHVEKDLGPKVVFRFDVIKALGSWAYLAAVPKRPDGKAIDYSKTKFAAAFKAGQFDDRVVAVLQKKNRKWTIYLYSIGDTDDPVATWMDKHPKVPWGSFGG